MASDHNTSDYRSFHEAFMQNHNGTTAGDVLMTILPSTFTTCLAKYLIFHYGISKTLCKLGIEYLTIIVPAVLVTTVWSDYRLLWFFISMGLLLTVHLKNFSIKDALSSKIDRRKRLQCISDVRFLTLILTAFSILAVDFRIFPRYFAKTEKYGYSLMDTGVGLFIFCNALVPSKVSRHSLFKSLELNLRQCAVLIVLGVVRALVTKEIDYQQHVTEYGIHWNFFITLAVAKFSATIIMCIFHERNALMSGLLLMCFHEIALSKGLGMFVLSEIPRSNFFLANREGLVSCPGYVALYLISSYVGQTIREKYNDVSEGDVISSLLGIMTVAWIGVYLTDPFLGASRCLVNAGYSFFIIALGTTNLVLFFFYEISEVSIIGKKNKLKKQNFVNPLLIISSAINNNGLLFFLLSNILTGLINLTFHTLHMGTVSSLLVLFSYMFFIIIIIVLFHLKFDSSKSGFVKD